MGAIKPTDDAATDTVASSSSSHCDSHEGQGHHAAWCDDAALDAESREHGTKY